MFRNFTQDIWDMYTAYTLWVRKKLGHFYFYCNFDKCWSIFEILSVSESERNGEHLNANNYCYLLSSVVLFDDVDVTSSAFVYSVY